MRELAIREVAEQTGLAAGTIRMWEQRYGFPEPQRTPSGYRVYSPADVEVLRRVLSLRKGGLSVPAALEQARAAEAPPALVSFFGAVPHQGRHRRLTKRTLIALSRAIEDETMAAAASPVVLGAFQRTRHYRGVEHRYQRMAKAADIAAVYADFDGAVDFEPGAPAEVPIDVDEAVGHEWAVVVDAPGFSVALVAWEPPVRTAPADDRDRVFETFWTLDPQAVRSAAQAGAVIARPTAPGVADEIERVLDARPLGPTPDVAALERLTTRMVAYLEAA